MTDHVFFVTGEPRWMQCIAEEAPRHGLTAEPFRLVALSAGGVEAKALHLGGMLSNMVALLRVIAGHVMGPSIVIEYNEDGQIKRAEVKGYTAEQTKKLLETARNIHVTTPAPEPKADAH